MGALPKIKISKGRRDRRRANDFLKKPQISICPKCSKAKRPHFVCEFCGYYGDGKDLKKKKNK
jgi:large subunit ribosomal protein L32